MIDGFLSGDSSPQIRSNVSLSDASECDSPPPPADTPEEVDIEVPDTPSPSLSETIPIDGSKEATIAVIMNLLEAEAGFGGLDSVTTMPWFNSI